MNFTKEPEHVCIKCNAEVSKRHINPEHCDVNTKSLLLMFCLKQVVMIECPKCGAKLMLV